MSPVPKSNRYKLADGEAAVPPGNVRLIKGLGGTRAYASEWSFHGLRGGTGMGRLAVILALGLAALPARGGDWWAAFDHSGLSAAIEQGLADHPDPAAALARIRAAESEVDTASAGRRPDAAAAAGYRWGREQSMRTGGVEDDIDPLMASARLSWELDVFGRVGAEVDAAGARAAVRIADAEAVRLALSLEIARTYLDLAGAAEEIEWLAQRTAHARALRDRAARRVGAGLDAPGDLRLAEAGVQQAEHHLMEAETRRDQSLARLRGLLGGRDPDVLPDTLSGFALPPPPDLATTNLVLARPDVVGAYQAWMAAEGDARSAARNRLPSLALVVSAAGEGSEAGDPEEWSAWAGPVLSVPLWEPARGSRARSASAQAGAAEADFATVSLRAVREIDTAWASRNRSEAMIRHMAERASALHDEAASLARKREVGLIQEADLLRARMAHADAARDHAAWIRAGLRAQVNLIGALGGLAD